MSLGKLRKLHTYIKVTTKLVSRKQYWKTAEWHIRLQQSNLVMSFCIISLHNSYILIKYEDVIKFTSNMTKLLSIKTKFYFTSYAELQRVYEKK